MEHIALDDVVSLLLEARAKRLIVAASYDNPDTPEDEYWRFLSPMRFVQTKSNLLALFWQYAPSFDYRSMRLHYFQGMLLTPYPGLLEDPDAFDLSNAIEWSQVDTCTRRRCPYGRRSKRRQRQEEFLMDVGNQIRHLRPDVPGINFPIWSGQ